MPTPLYGAGDAFDELLDRLHDIGAPPRALEYGRFPGTPTVWLRVRVCGRPLDVRGDSLESCARLVMRSALECSERDRARATEELARP